MTFPKRVELLHVPSGILVDAHVIRLTDTLIRRRMGRSWWVDPAIDTDAAEREIDRDWDWTKLHIEFSGRIIRSAKLGVVTGDGAVQGAMMISTQHVMCEREPGGRALFVELLFAAPRNRHWIRADHTEQFRGVGLQLLRTAAQMSVEVGCEGRLKLESSPGFVDWYKKRGLLVVSEERILHEGVEYTPMELPADRVDMLLTP